MSPEEQEVSLVVQRHDLPALEFGQRREEVLEHLADAVTERGDEAVEDELGMVRRRARVVLSPQVNTP